MQFSYQQTFFHPPPWLSPVFQKDIVPKHCLSLHRVFIFSKIQAYPKLSFWLPLNRFITILTKETWIPILCNLDVICTDRVL